MEPPRKTPESKGKRVLLLTVAMLGFLTGAARIATAFYFLAEMPRLPDPARGRVYPSGAAYNTAVYVTSRELKLVDFLNYDLMTLLGLGVILIAVFVIIPKTRREGQL